MGVKTIFKVLIGALVIPAVVALLIELIGATVNGNQFTTDLRDAVLTACDFYSQESYRNKSGSSTYSTLSEQSTKIKYKDTDGNIQELKDPDGNSYGDFYGGTTEEEIYTKLYPLDNEMFKSTIKEYGVSDDKMKKMIRAYNDKVYLSPMNLGCTYMDKDTLTRIIRWSLCKRLSKIETDASGNSYDTHIGRWLSGETGDNKVYIKCGGFLVDPNSLVVNTITPKVYNFSVESDKKDFKAKFGYLPDNCSSINSLTVLDIDCDVDMKYKGVAFLNSVTNMKIENVKGVDNTTAHGGIAYGEGYSATYGDTNGNAVKNSAGGVNTTMSKLHGNIVYYKID